MKTFWELTVLMICLPLIQESTGASTCATHQIKNGRAKLRSGGRRVKYSCRRPYTTYGRRSAWCINGAWTSPPPVCIKSGCPTITTIPNGDVKEQYNGAVLIFTCSAGHTMDGTDTLVCDGDTWNDAKPVCVAAAAITECDFEDEGLCGWIQAKDPDDNFDWTWHVGATPTGYTGPSRDHTLGENSDTGHYLYIETSSPREEEDHADLLSPLYPPEASGQCFSFWYHMLGPDEEGQVGALMVFVRPDGLKGDESKPAFYTEGHQGFIWLKGEVFIDSIDTNFQIVIRGKKKSSYLSDIAIDDVSLGNCSVLAETTVPGMTTVGKETPTTILPVITSQTVSVLTTMGQYHSTTAQPVSTSEQPTQSTGYSLTTTLLPSTTSSLKTKSASPSKTEPAIRQLETSSVTTLPEKRTTTPTVITTSSLTTVPSTESTTISTAKISSSTPPPTTTKIKKWTTKQKLPKTPAPETSPKIPDTTTTMIKSSQKTSPTIRTKLPSTRSRYSSSSPKTTNKLPLSTKFTVFFTNPTSGNTTWPSTQTSYSVSDANKTSVNDSTTLINLLTTESSNDTEIEVILQTNLLQRSEDKIQPLMIGIGVGVAVGLVVIIVLVFFWVRNQRLKIADEDEEEMAPITKHGSRSSLN
ncbi:hypothetical protein ScPMuIL_015857 [Solemya velum]